MKYIRNRENQYKNIIGISLGCIYLFFTYLSGSIYVPLWVNRGTLIVFLVYSAINTMDNIIKGSFRLSMYSIWYGAFICYTIVSFTFSSNTKGFSSNHFYQMMVCFVITMFYLDTIQSKKMFNMICWAYALSSFLMIILLYRNGQLVGDYNKRLGNDVSGNANIFATFIMYSVLYELWLLVTQQYSFQIRSFLLISIITNIYALALSAGRKYFIAPFVFLYVLLLLYSNALFIKKIVKYSLIMIIFIALTYLIVTRVPIIYNSIGIRMEQMINSIMGKGVVEESLRIRSMLRKVAINEWIKRPLFGYGFDTFKYMHPGGMEVYSHCNYTELLYNGGIVYFFIYYCFYLFLIWKAIYKKKKTRLFFSFAIAALITQIMLDYGGVFYDILTTQVFLVMVVKALDLSDIDEKKLIDL